MKSEHKVTIKVRDIDGQGVASKNSFQMPDLGPAVMFAVAATGGQTLEVLAEAVAEFHNVNGEHGIDSSACSEQAMAFVLTAHAYIEACGRYRHQGK